MDILTFIAILVALGTLALIAAFAIRVAERAFMEHLQRVGAARELGRAQINTNLALQTQGRADMSDKLKDILNNGV